MQRGSVARGPLFDGQTSDLPPPFLQRPGRPAAQTLPRLDFCKRRWPAGGFQPLSLCFQSRGELPVSSGLAFAETAVLTARRCDATAGREPDAMVKLGRLCHRNVSCLSRCFVVVCEGSGPRPPSRRLCSNAPDCTSLCIPQDAVLPSRASLPGAGKVVVFSATPLVPRVYHRSRAKLCKRCLKHNLLCSDLAS